MHFLSSLPSFTNKKYWLMSLAIVSCFSWGDTLEQARKIERQTNQVAQQTQKKINTHSDHILQLQGEIEQLQAQIESLSIYQTHLTKLVESQEAEKVSIENQLQDIIETRQGVVPLMYRMIEGLEQLTQEGIPVRIQSRQQRLQDIHLLMGRADISDAEKYRRILEAYQIEMDYGSKLGTYQGEISLSSTDIRQVDILHLGKLVLLARSKDAQHAWLWSQDEKGWKAIAAAQQAQVNQAYDLAEQQQAPSILTLPLSVTQISASVDKEMQ